MDIPPNQTIYVNNLYEKLPKEGRPPPARLGPALLARAPPGGEQEPRRGRPDRRRDRRRDFRRAAARSHAAGSAQAPGEPAAITARSHRADVEPAPRRAEEMRLRHVLPVRQDPGRGGAQDVPDAGAGMGGLQRRGSSDERAQIDAGLPLLRQAHRERRVLRLAALRRRALLRPPALALAAAGRRPRWSRRTAHSCATAPTRPAADHVRQDQVGRGGQAGRHLQG
jgi:hypothetical protein